MVAPATTDPAIYVRDVENVVFFAGNGTDLLRVNDIRDSGVGVLEVDLGGDDFAPDQVVVQGSTGNDNFTLNTDTPNLDERTYDKIRTTAKINGSSATTYSLIVGGTNRDHGDVLRFETGDGNDTVDAGALGGAQTISTGMPAVQTTVHGSDLIELQFVTGAGNDRLIGSPWNDLLDGGTGSDRYTGGDGLDTFFDDSPASDVDVLVESFDRDMGLFDDTFTLGSVTSPTGGPFGLTPPITEAELKAEFLVDDPDLRFPYVGDYWTLSTIVEDLKFIFEEAELTGGDGRNVMVVGDSDGVIRVGGAIRNVQAWTGRRRSTTVTTPRTRSPSTTSSPPWAGTAPASASVTAPATTCCSCSAPTAPTGSRSTPRATVPTAPASSRRGRSTPTAPIAVTRSSIAASSCAEIYLLGGADHVLSNDTARDDDHQHGRRRRRARHRHRAAHPRYRQPHARVPRRRARRRHART